MPHLKPFVSSIFKFRRLTTWDADMPRLEGPHRRHWPCAVPPHFRPSSVAPQTWLLRCIFLALPSDQGRLAIAICGQTDQRRLQLSHGQGRRERGNEQGRSSGSSARGDHVSARVSARNCAATGAASSSRDGLDRTRSGVQVRTTSRTGHGSTGNGRYTWYLRKRRY